MANPNSPAGPANIKRFQITSNKNDGSYDISASVSEFRYYESVLSNNVTASITYIETGNIKGNDKSVAIDGLVDSLPIRGGERTDIEMEDNYGNTLKFKTGLYVNRVRSGAPTPTRDLYMIDLASKEYFANEQVRVIKRYKDAPISTHVQEILKNVLKYDETIDVDTTTLNYNFYGNDRKPFYICTWLASKSIPQVSASGGSGGNTLGGAAGYLFFQTRDALHFKSIDNLFKQKPVKKYIFTNTPSLPENYDEKILSYTIGSDMDLKQNMTLGTYNNRTIFYDPVSFNYVVRNYGIDDQKNKITTAGKQEAGELVADVFTKSPSRLLSAVMDVGYNPPGATTEAQLEAWKNNPQTRNFDAPKTMVQSIMRYNQLFTIQTNVTIKGDFSIKAGDIIRCDFPQLQGKTGTSVDINKKTSGDYLVAHVCHRVTPSETFTSLGLIRDSYGIKEIK